MESKTATPLEEIVVEENMKCCSDTMTESNVHYFTKLSFLILMTTFAMSMLIYDVVTKNDCNPIQSVYIGILTGVMGIFVQTPEKKKR
jgi:hypothetical protein